MTRTCVVAALLLTITGCGAATAGAKPTTPKTANVPTPTVRILSPTADELLPSHGPLTVHLAVTNFTLVSATSGDKPGSGQIVLTFGAYGVSFKSVTTSQLTVQISPPPGSNLLEANLVTNGKTVGNTASVTLAGGPSPASATSATEPPFCPSPPVGTHTASQVRVSLPIHVLPTEFGIPMHIVFPKAVSLTIPRQWAGQVAAYGVAGCVILAPIGWTGSGLVGADGNTAAHLHATAAATIVGSLTFSTIPACYGCAMTEASLYFPSVVKACRQAYPPGTDCGPPLTMKRDFLKPGLLAYSLSPTVNGVAETTLVHSALSQVFLFAMEQVSLPQADVPLETVSLNYFVSITPGYQ